MLVGLCLVFLTQPLQLVNLHATLHQLGYNLLLAGALLPLLHYELNDLLVSHCLGHGTCGQGQQHP